MRVDYFPCGCVVWTVSVDGSVDVSVVGSVGSVGSVDGSVGMSEAG